MDDLRNTPNMAERTLLHVSEERDKYRKALEEILATGYSDAGPGFHVMWFYDMREIARKALNGGE